MGDLKNAWLMAALVGMAENPKLIERLFVSKKYNEQGFYKIRICVNGEWSVVVVDDYIPCQINGGPIFTRGNGNELWVMLIEKAYAKAFGNYNALEGG